MSNVFVFDMECDDDGVVYVFDGPTKGVGAALAFVNGYHGDIQELRRGGVGIRRHRRGCGCGYGQGLPPPAPLRETGAETEGRLVLRPFVLGSS